MGVDAWLTEGHTHVVKIAANRPPDKQSCESGNDPRMACASEAHRLKARPKPTPVRSARTRDAERHAGVAT